MGNSHNRRLQEYLEQYEVVGKDDVEGVIYLRSKEQYRSYFMKELYTSMGAERWNLEAVLRQRMQLSHQHLLFPEDFILNLQRQESTQPAAWVLYASPGGTLEEERRQRTILNCYFGDGQLWSILASVILAHSYLESNNIRNQSLRTQNIYIGEEGSILILDPLCNQLRTNYRIKKEEDEGEHVYVSPAEKDSLLKNKRYPSHNSYKSSVFVAGMIMLELALLKQLKGDTEREIEGYLKEASERYPEDLVTFLRQMVRMNEAKRMDWLALENYSQKDTIISQSRMLGISRLSKLSRVSGVYSGLGRNSEDTFRRKELKNTEQTTGTMPLSNNLNHKTSDIEKVSLRLPLQKMNELQSEISSVPQRSRVLSFASIQPSILFDNKVEVNHYPLQVSKGVPPRILIQTPIKQHQNHDRPRPHYNQKISLLQVSRTPKSPQQSDLKMQAPLDLRSHQIPKTQPSVCFSYIQPQVQVHSNHYRVVKKIDYTNLNSVQDCWIRYTGGMVEGKMSGKGTLLYSDGSIYEGGFLNNMAHGEGMFFAKTGSIRGVWSQNKLIEGRR